MLNRRDFLQAGGAIAIATMTTGCRNAALPLNIYLLDRSLPPSLVREFQQQLKDQSNSSSQPTRSPNFVRESTLPQIVALLKRWQDPSPPSNPWQWVPIIGGKPKPPGQLVTLGDAWLGRAIRNQWIQPLDTAALNRWSQLPNRWQQLMRRNNQGQPDPQGEVWGAPYRWGVTLIVYNQAVFDKFGWEPPRDWLDLWRPELQGRVALIDQPREIIGLTLKSLGKSYNTPNLDQVPQLTERLSALNQNVRSYSSKHYLQPLLLKDAWVAVGWSTDVLPALRTYGQLRAVVPESGTAIWSDIWVQPAQVEPLPLLNQWLDFCWQDRATQSISLFTDGFSPLFDPKTAIARNTTTKPLLQSSTEILVRSEFLESLPVETQKQYDTVWRKVRSAPSTSTPE